MRAEMKSSVFVGIGEVLYDVFENGSETLGGAPLNVAVHAHELARKLGVGEGVVVSSIGADQRGRNIVDSLQRRGMSSGYLAVDTCHPTGVVSVSLRDGEAGYQIEAGAAWDYLGIDDTLIELACRCDAVCFGSLAQRAPVSREAIRTFLQNAPQAIRLYDVNLRRNTVTGEADYSAEIIESSCQLATIIKANQAELITITELLGIGSSTDRGVKGIWNRMQLFLARFPVCAVVVTRGADGIFLLTREGEFESKAPHVPEEKFHPVGAGDACSAGVLVGFSAGWDLASTLELANRMGADVASKPSATPPLADSVVAYARARTCQKGSADS
jgi:fructokinase